MSGEGDTALICQTVQDVEDNLMDNMKRGWRVVGKTVTGEKETVIQDNKITAESLNTILEKRNQEFQEYLLMPSITAG